MKRLLTCLPFVLCAAGAWALEFTVAPLYFIDESAGNAGSADPRSNWHLRLLEELQAVETGTDIRFRAVGSAIYNPPQSVGDAVAVSRTERTDYLIYGFITRKDYTLQGELRLLDYEKRETAAVFYAMDNRDAEDALVKTLAAKILAYIQDNYHIGIVPEPDAFTHVQFPIGLGYWFPAEKSWTPLLIGIFRFDAGVQFIPSDHALVLGGYAHYFSLGIDLSYRLGKGRYYEAWNHGFTVSAPVRFHRIFNSQHEAYAGLGISYSFDILSVKKPYEDPELEGYGAAGLLVNGGWAFRFKEKIYIFAELCMELRFYDDPMFSIAPSVGVILRPYTQEVVRKW
jgi:hypothetical protein